jgi:hypothetical protein
MVVCQTHQICDIPSCRESCLNSPHSPQNHFITAHPLSVCAVKHSHKGVVGTIRELRSVCCDVPYSTLHAEVTKVCSQCLTCQRVRQAISNSSLPQGILSGSPFAELSVDSLGPFPADKERNVYLIVVIDSFSRFIWLILAPSNTTLDAARTLNPTRVYSASAKTQTLLTNWLLVS